MNDLIVDPQIRAWVFLPIVVISFLIGIIRHYTMNFISSEKKMEPQVFQDNQALIRCVMIRENHSFIPKSGFLMRRSFLTDAASGYLMQKRPPAIQSMMVDPALITDMIKGNVTNVLPMVIIGGWINWMFSGFIATRVPFPLTLRFKPMLQREIELDDLDASWVSSASWYFLNVFGLRNIYDLVLGENNSADHTQVMQMQEQMMVPIDIKLAFKTEWEALEIIRHKWQLSGIESRIVELFKRQNDKFS